MNDALGKISRFLIAIIAGINIAICLTFSLYSTISFTARRFALLDTMSGKEIRVARVKTQTRKLLAESDITVKEVSLEDIPEGNQYSFYIDGASKPFFPVVELTKEQNENIDSIAR